MHRRPQPFRQAPMVRTRLRARLQPFQIPPDRIPPLLQLPFLALRGLPAALPPSKTPSPPLSRPSVHAATGNSQTTPKPAETRRVPAPSSPRNPARSFRQHQRVLRVIVALMAAKSRSVAALSTKNVFIRPFVQNATSCMRPKVAGTSSPIVPGTSCPKSPEILPHPLTTDP